MSKDILEKTCLTSCTLRTMKEEIMKVVKETDKIQKNLDAIRSPSTPRPSVKTSPPAPGLGGGLPLDNLDLDTWHVLPLDTLDTWHVLPLDTLDDLVARFILPVPETLRADYNR